MTEEENKEEVEYTDSSKLLGYWATSLLFWETELGKEAVEKMQGLADSEVASAFLTLGTTSVEDTGVMFLLELAEVVEDEFDYDFESYREDMERKIAVMEERNQEEFFEKLKEGRVCIEFDSAEIRFQVDVKAKYVFEVLGGISTGIEEAMKDGGIDMKDVEGWIGRVQDTSEDDDDRKD